MTFKNNNEAAALNGDIDTYDLRDVAKKLLLLLWVIL